MRFQSRPAGNERVPKARNLEKVRFAEGRLDKGMITVLDPADIPEGALQLGMNVNVRFDKTLRRPGTLLLSPTKPDSNSVLGLFFVKLQNGNSHTLRFTPSSLHSLGVGSWNALTGTLTGGATDRFSAALIRNQFIFANNGADPIQVVDFDLATFGNLGNAPPYRYVAGLYNRAVGAALRDSNEVQIGWSADGNIEEWDPLVNETAGSAPLYDSPADLSDYITGLFSVSNVLAVLREKSIWIGTRQPVPTNPFYFHNVIPSIGCDSPFSAQVVPGGIVWMDVRSGSVYYYAVGSQPERIGGSIENKLITNVDDPSTIFSGYDPINAEYTIAIPQAGTDLVTTWTYSFRNKAWVKGEYFDITSINNVELSIGGLMIDQLSGTIDDLTGNINNLSPSTTIAISKSFGRGTGEIQYEDVNCSQDAQSSTETLDGLNYTSYIRSKAFVLPEVDMYICEIRIEYVMKQGGELRLEYSKDGGYTEDSWRLAKEVRPNILDKPQILTYRKNINARRFSWQLVMADGLFDILSFEIFAYPGATSKQ